MRNLTEKLLNREDLTSAEASSAALCFAEGEFSPIEAAAFLVAFQAKGYTAAELASFAAVFRERAEPLERFPVGVVDTCGTGGGAPSWNLSTGAAIVAAAAGAKVAKHGNRAVTSRCGSADVLEALGVKLDASPHHCLTESGIAFLYAPQYHPAFKYVGSLRRELGIRTIFNVLGPLLNPVKASHQVIGVNTLDLLSPMAQAAVLLGCDKAVVAHGRDGLDEISPAADSDVAVATSSGITSHLWGQSDFGSPFVATSALAPGETAEENADIIRMAISEASSPRAAALLPGTAVALWLAGKADSLSEGAALAKETISIGAATRLLERWVEVSHSS